MSETYELRGAKRPKERTAQDQAGQGSEKGSKKPPEAREAPRKARYAWASGRKPDSFKPLFTAEQLQQQLRMYDRQPFMDLLAVWLECAPDPEAIIAFADKYPEKWAQSISQIAKTAGFSERKEVQVDVLMDIRNMSDSQIEDRLKKLLSDSSDVSLNGRLIEHQMPTTHDDENR